MTSLPFGRGFEMVSTVTTTERRKLVARHAERDGILAVFTCPRCQRRKSQVEVGWLVNGKAGSVLFMATVVTEPGPLSVQGPFPDAGLRAWPKLAKDGDGKWQVVNQDERATEQFFVLHRFVRAMKDRDLLGDRLPPVMTPDEMFEVPCCGGDEDPHHLILTGSMVLNTLDAGLRAPRPARVATEVVG